MVLEKNMLKNEKKMNKTNLRTIKTHSQDHHNAVPGPLKNMLKNEKKSDQNQSQDHQKRVSKMKKNMFKNEQKLFKT